MSSVFDRSLADAIGAKGIIAVLVVEDAEDAVPLARALVGGGITAMELTLRTPAAMDALERIVAEVPEMTAGIGTILTPEQARSAKEAGAVFGVSPGFNRRVVQAAMEAGLPFAPGIATPSEVEACVELGCDVLKLFPAEQLGGLRYLKALEGPYGFLGLRYIPLGGVGLGNLADWLQEDAVLAVGGSWIAPKDLIGRKAWGKIGENAAEAAGILRGARG